MAGLPNGIYSVAAIAVAGASLLLLRIENGRIFGNDTAGSRYEGDIYEHDVDHVKIALYMTLPPKALGIWGTNETETFQTRQFNEIIPKSAFAGTPPTLPGYELTVIGTQVPPEHGYLAEPDGIDQHIKSLQDVQLARQRMAHDRPAALDDRPLGGASMVR